MYAYLYTGIFVSLLPLAYRPKGQVGVVIGWLNMRIHITKHGCMGCMETDRFEVHV